MPDPIHALSGPIRDIARDLKGPSVLAGGMDHRPNFPATPPARYHELDWLRIIAIALVLFFHVGMIFVSWRWHINDGEDAPLLRHVMLWLHLWRMPLLLFISGAATFLVLGRRSAWNYSMERHRRLLIPLVFGMLVVVPPQIYIEKIAQYSSFGQFYPTIFELRPYPEGNTSWHHLWFILYLLLYSQLALPFFLWFRSERATRARAVLDRWLSRRAVLPLTFAGLLLGASLLLRPYFPHDTHALIDDWAGFTDYFLSFVAGFVCCALPGVWNAIRRDRWLHLALGVTSLGGLYAAYHTFPHTGFIHRGWDVLWGTVCIVTGVSWILTLVGFAQVWLCRPHAWLRSLNEGVYPFYILHQTAIVGIGYAIIQFTWPMPVKFIVIAALATAASIGAYVVLIRPFNLMRLLFGMNPLRQVPARSVAATSAGHLGDVAHQVDDLACNVGKPTTSA